jgi:carbon monoxide dehydrogenase subunit G
MSEILTFESRTGRLTCNAEELFHFLTDIRNFERFIPKGNFSDIITDKDSCFNVSMIGKVNIHIKDKTEFREVVFSGTTLQVNEFSLVVKFHDTESGQSDVRLSALAALSPFLKMIVSEPINKFLETIIAEMEKFRGWKEIRGDN